MTTPPATLDGHRVLAYAPVNAGTVPTERVEHILDGERLHNVQALAICWAERERRAALMRCTDRWRVLTDTWHATTEEAGRQADYEYEGLEWTHLRT